MELKTAIEILDYHQEWRQGKRENMAHEPKKLTEALDVVLEQVKKLNIHNVIVPLCECGGNERVALDCTSKKCKHPKYSKE